MPPEQPKPLVSFAPLPRRARYVVLAVAFFGWFFAGVQMSITPLVSRSAAIDLLYPGQSLDSLGDEQKKEVEPWFAWYNAAFLLGAATGGLAFGWIGDRLGRSRGMGWSSVWFSGMSGLSYFARTPEELLVLRFLGCLGVGGMWPNGTALAAEAWPNVSRPALAGIIGTAANVGQVCLGLVACNVRITPDNWRWVMLVGAAPLALGAFSLAVVPESPRWLAGRHLATTKVPVSEVLRPPLLGVTLLGILLGTIPLLGGWGSGNWLVPWTERELGQIDPYRKALTQVQRSAGGAISSLLGGWVASLLGRRLSYFLISAGSVAMSAYIFRELKPADPEFGWCALALGFVTGFYFGWLPLCLPEMFPTRVRATGAGITFNMGRVPAALGVLGAGWLTTQYGGDLGRVGAVTSLIYVLGLVVIWFAPLGKSRHLED
jgi:MFS family permease